jgi:hypothetical protein
MKHMFLSVLLFGCFGSLHAQSSLGLDYQRTRILSLSVTDFIDLFAPSCLIGFNHSLSPAWSVFAEGGPLTTFGGNYLPGRKLTGYKFRFEVRRYNTHSTNNRKSFLALQFMIRQFMQKGLQGEFKIKGSAAGVTEYLDYNFSKTVNAIHILRGKSRTWGRFSLELAVFAGLRFRYPDFIGVPTKAEYIEPSGFLFPNITYRQKNPDVLPSIGVTSRIGFRL